MEDSCSRGGGKNSYNRHEDVGTSFTYHALVHQVPAQQDAEPRLRLHLASSDQASVAMSDR